MAVGSFGAAKTKKKPEQPFHEQRAGAKKEHHSIEDSEGLLVNLAVVAALMLSFVIAVYTAAGGDTFDRAMFRHMCMKSHDFCTFARAELEDGGFSFDFRVSADEFKNMREAMCDEKWYIAPLGGATNSGGTDPASEQKAVIERAFAAFPIPAMKMWMEAHSYLWRSDGDAISRNDVVKFYYFGAFGVAFLSVALIGSILLYVVLILSPAREGTEMEPKNYNALKVYQYWAHPLVFLLYLCALLGCLCFYYQCAGYVEATVPFPHHGDQVFTMWSIFFVIPSGVVLMVLSVIILILAKVAVKKGVKAVTSEVTSALVGERVESALREQRV